MIQHQTLASTPAESLIRTGQAPNSWQTELKQLICEPEQLFELLQLQGQDLECARAACRDFLLRVPRPYAARIEPGNSLTRYCFKCSTGSRVGAPARVQSRSSGRG